MIAPLSNQNRRGLPCPGGFVVLQRRFLYAARCMTPSFLSTRKVSPPFRRIRPGFSFLDEAGKYCRGQRRMVRAQLHTLPSRKICEIPFQLSQTQRDAEIAFSDSAKESFFVNSSRQMLQADVFGIGERKTQVFRFILSKSIAALLCLSGNPAAYRPRNRQLTRAKSGRPASPASCARACSHAAGHPAAPPLCHGFAAKRV